MIKEFCAENFTDIPKALAAGASRIELCDNLFVGGTTPSTGVIEEVLAYAGERGGDFVYNDIELKIMHTDLIEAKKLGTDGVVFGLLQDDGWLDEESLELFLETAEGLQVTFHMAFDAIPKTRQKEAIDWLAAHGVDRILTHGGPSGSSLEENLPYLKELVDYAAGRIIILPGGGVTAENVEEVITTLGVKEAHGTKIVSF